MRCYFADRLPVLQTSFNYGMSFACGRTHLRDLSFYATNTDRSSPTAKPPLPIALLISGTAPPPRDDLLFYDVLLYETHWYAPQIAQHPNIVHAFGVDAERIQRLAKAHNREAAQLGREFHSDFQFEYDYLFVGIFASYKRPELLLTKPGRKLAVGHRVTDNDSEEGKRHFITSTVLLIILSHSKSTTSSHTPIIPLTHPLNDSLLLNAVVAAQRSHSPRQSLSNSPPPV